VQLLVLFLAFAVVAACCPVCNSETGQQVRSSILNSDFGFNFLAAVLPFAICVFVAGLIHRGAAR
jgi:hypothetical protein